MRRGDPGRRLTHRASLLQHDRRVHLSSLEEPACDLDRLDVRVGESNLVFGNDREAHGAPERSRGLLVDARLRVHLAGGVPTGPREGDVARDEPPKPIDAFGRRGRQRALVDAELPELGREALPDGVRSEGLSHDRGRSLTPGVARARLRLSRRYRSRGSHGMRSFG